MLQERNQDPLPLRVSLHQYKQPSSVPNNDGLGRTMKSPTADGRIYVGRLLLGREATKADDFHDNMRLVAASPFEDTQRNCGNLIYKNPTSLFFSRTISAFLFPHRLLHSLHPRWLPTRESRSTNPSPSLAKLPFVVFLSSSVVALNVQLTLAW